MKTATMILNGQTIQGGAPVMVRWERRASEAFRTPVRIQPRPRTERVSPACPERGLSAYWLGESRGKSCWARRIEAASMALLGVGAAASLILGLSGMSRFVEHWQSFVAWTARLLG